MSSLKKNVFLSVFGAAMSATVAFAADLPAPPIIEYEPEVPIEIGSGWYLRGDIGFAAYQGGEGYWQPLTGATRYFYDNSVETGWVVGAGVGYYFNEHFRTDLTLDWRSKIKGTGKADCTAPCGYTTESVNFGAWTLMLNGYYDFGGWYGFTPYVGAGLGVARLSTSGYKSSDATSLTFKGKPKYNFAWNLMAGTSYQLTDQVKLDANYRFVSLGEARTGGPKNGSAQNPVKYKNLYAHDFRLGLRYDIN